jgi:rhodanese-related sulfurtransferase
MSVPRLSIAAIAAFLLLSINACSRDKGPTLAAPEAYARAQAGTLTLIDIRHSDEWRRTGVAKGALRIDMTNSQGEAGFVEQVVARMGGRKDAPIGLISIAGNRGANAQRVLRKAGFTQVYNIKEGMTGSGAGPGWIARGLPVEACNGC